MIFAVLGLVALLVAALEWSHRQERQGQLDTGRRLLAMVEAQNSLLRTYAGGDAPAVIYQPVEVPNLYGTQNGQSEDPEMPPLLNEMLGGFGEAEG